MWRPNESIGDDVSGTRGIDPRSKRRRTRRRAWRDGLADQTVVTTLKRGPSYRAFERVLIGGVDPRIGWQACCGDFVVPVRSKRGLFELQGETLLARRRDPSRGPRQPGPPPTRANVRSI